MEEYESLETIDPVLLGKRLAVARKAARLTTMQVRSKLGYMLRDRFPAGLLLYQIEAGEQRPPAIVLIALAEIYDRPLHDLFHEKPESTEEIWRLYGTSEISEGTAARWLGIDRLELREQALQKGYDV